MCSSRCWLTIGVVLAGLATDYLAGDTEAPKMNFISGREDVTVALPPVARFPAYTLTGPNPPEQIVAPSGTADLKLRQAQAPGNYVLKGQANDAEANSWTAAFSVNVASEESDLSRVPPREIESLFGPDAVIAAGRKTNIRDILKGHWSEPVELFPLLMVILLLILAVENLLANKFYRRDNEKESDDSKSGGTP